MMKKTSILTSALLAALLLVSIYTVFPVKSEARNDVDVLFYGSHEAAYGALIAGDVDFIQWSLTEEQRLAVEDMPDICVAGYSENGMMEFDINNNYTVPMTYPGIQSPTSNKHFRRAISCMVDKTYIIDEILRGAAELLNVPIPVNSKSWWPTCALEGHPYEWEYNLTKAEEQLQLAGFIDTDSNGIRNYPSGWPGAETGPDMDPLIFYIRTEDKRLDAGRYLASQLDYFDIAYAPTEGTSDVCFPPVMDDRNYHIYTGGWSLGRYPLFLYNGFHESFWYEGGSNYVTGMNSSNLPNYPDYDKLSRLVYYTTGIAASQAAAKTAAALGWCDYVFNIPLWSYSSYVGWRKAMAGVINEFGYGYDNVYQFLKAYDTSGGGIIKMGTISAPKAMNPLYSTWYYDYAVLDRVYNNLLMVNPYDLGTDQPGAAQDWEVGTWIDLHNGTGEPQVKTKVTYYLRKDVGMVTPDGAFVRNINAHDLEFSCWYIYAFSDGWNWADYSDVHHSVVVDDYTIEYYFDDASYWFYTAPQYPLLPKTELIDTLCKMSSVTIDGPLPADTFVKLGTTEQIVQVTDDDLGVAYNICGGYEDYEHNWIYLPDALPAGTYTIDYYTTDLEADGYFLAGLDWTQTWYSFGPFYAIGITPGVGGSVSFNKNPYYWMGESPPPLGEVDWRYVWDTPGNVAGPEIPGRDSGYYETSIFDVVKATGCYGHIGYGPYDPIYFPGADLDKTDLGTIGIYDIVSITGKYGMTWGQPPP